MISASAHTEWLSIMANPWINPLKSGSSNHAGFPVNDWRVIVAVAFAHLVAVPGFYFLSHTAPGFITLTKLKLSAIIAERGCNIEALSYATEIPQSTLSRWLDPALWG